MLTLIVTVLFGLALAYFATQNTGHVSIVIVNLLFQDIPLYMLVVGSLLLGLFVSWIISLVDNLSSALTISAKQSAIQKGQQAIQTLEERIHELEIENARLKTGNEEKDEKEKAVSEVQEGVRPPSRHQFPLIHNLRHHTV